MVNLVYMAVGFAYKYKGSQETFTVAEKISHGGRRNSTLRLLLTHR